MAVVIFSRMISSFYMLKLHLCASQGVIESENMHRSNQQEILLSDDGFLKEPLVV